MKPYFDWCRCSEHIWPHWHINPDDPHDIKVLGEDEDDAAPQETLEGRTNPSAS